MPNVSKRAQALIHILSSLRPEPQQGAEIGVSRGSTSATLLRRFPGLFLYMIDAWTAYPVEHPYRRSGDGHAQLTEAEQNEHARRAEAATAFASERRTILRMESHIAATKIPDGSLDFAFIDADHTYEAVAADIGRWWPKIRSGGMLCGHDYGHLKDRRGAWGVARAVEEFALRHGLAIEIGRGTVWSVRRLGTRCDDNGGDATDTLEESGTGAVSIADPPSGIEAKPPRKLL